MCMFKKDLGPLSGYHRSHVRDSVSAENAQFDWLSNAVRGSAKQRVLANSWGSWWGPSAMGGAHAVRHESKAPMRALAMPAVPMAMMTTIRAIAAGVRSAGGISLR